MYEVASPSIATDQDREHMRQAIELMRKAGIIEKTGGPFGCVIVRDGEVLAARQQRFEGQRSFRSCRSECHSRRLQEGQRAEP